MVPGLASGSLADIVYGILVFIIGISIFDNGHAINYSWAYYSSMLFTGSVCMLCILNYLLTTGLLYFSNSTVVY